MRLTVVGFVALVGLLVASFFAGMVYQPGAESDAAVAERRILRYVCPMHPAYTSDRPGKAPCCGMEMVAVYEGEGQAAHHQDAVPAGSIRVPLDRQQLVGVEMGVVERLSYAPKLRTVGRVAADDRRLYRINTAASGWIRETFSNSVGSLVRKDEPLATFYSRELQSAQQAYFYALDALDRFKNAVASEAQLETTSAQVRAAADALEALGMSATQIAEMARTRRRTERIELRSPVTGFILEKNVSPGQRFDSGSELYQIVDLKRVWILADVFESERRFVHAGSPATVVYDGEAVDASVSEVLPSFDSATRTMKVRLEIDNPGYRFRPDMFVDVEFPVALPAALVVPSEAVVDSGKRKVVFVDRGEGVFEPRQVETGWHFDNRTEIRKGLHEGERIAVSGNFLLDSESRMQAAMAGAARRPSHRDVICGMDVQPEQAKASGLVSTHDGKTYYFCSQDCKHQFDADPAAHAHQ